MLITEHTKVGKHLASQTTRHAGRSLFSSIRQVLNVFLKSSTYSYGMGLALVLLITILTTTWYATTSGAARSLTQERINVALGTNGGIVSASSIRDDDYTPTAVTNGDRRGIGWGAGGGWADSTPSVFPDWIEIEFAGEVTLDEIDVFTLQDTWWNPAEPTETMIFNNNGITAFDVQYWNGDNWINVTGGSVTANNKVWRKFVFAPVMTDRVRVFVKGSRSQTSNIVEIEAYGVLLPPPDPSPTPTPSPTPPPNGITADLAALDIHFDPENNVGFGTTLPIFNDDGTTGAFVGNWVAIDGKFPGAAAYLGIGGTVPTVGHRVGVLNFYNMAMGGADHRTAAIYSFNGSVLGTGNLEFYTSPNSIGPVRRLQIAPTGEVGINHAAGVGTMLEVMGKTTDASTKGLVVLDSADRPLLTVRSDGQISADKAGQGLVLKSPNGLICKKLTIDNSGNLVVANMVSCP